MACSGSCGIPEFYTDAPPKADVERVAPVPSPSCPAKVMMNNCLYTAQGTYVCNVELKGEKKTWGDDQNIEMMKQSFLEQRAFSHASPWGA